MRSPTDEEYRKKKLMRKNTVKDKIARKGYDKLRTKQSSF